MLVLSPDTPSRAHPAPRRRAFARAVAAGILALALVPQAPAQDAAEAGPDSSASGAANAPIPVKEIRTFTEVFAKIKEDYVEEVEDKKLLEDAIRGMLAGLDPHSAYLDEDEYAGLQEGTTGEFGGLGIEVGTEEGFIRVIAPIDDTPAAKAGIEAGDVIIRIDDSPVKGMSLNDAVKRMRGEPGTSIKLTISREGEGEPLEFVLERAIVKVTAVRSRILEPGFGYIRVSNFQARTGDDVREQLLELKRDAEGDLAGVILDLRNNPGGVLGAAVGVSDLFLDSGLIVYTEGRVADSKLNFSAKSRDILDGKPLVVLVNEGSASASEIVAGALQDQKRAVIVGRPTFGKGSVQTILPMNNKAALKLTTARYYTPNGRSIQAEGIVPDIAIDRVKVESIDVARLSAVKEANLARHLMNEAERRREEQAEQGIVDVEDVTDPRKRLALTDYELYEALNLLKSLALVEKRF